MFDWWVVRSKSVCYGGEAVFKIKRPFVAWQGQNWKPN